MDQVVDRDLNELADRLSRIAPRLQGARLFVTGGTGFFGSWFLRTLIRLNERQGLGARAVVLSRDPEAFRASCPEIAADPSIELLGGDIRSFAAPSATFTHVIHAATPVVEKMAPAELEDLIVSGTRRALELARKSGARLLFTSSGAVYGRKAWENGPVSEELPCLLDPERDAGYARGKLGAELLCAEFPEVASVIARCFATVGPGMEMGQRFAIGGFIRQALEGGPIRIESDGTPVRSYLYITDVIEWLYVLLAVGKPLRPYNVGSERRIMIRELAEEVADALESPARVEVNGTVIPGRRPEVYVPLTRRAREELGLAETVPLREAIRRTAAAWRTRR
ncbi:MAG TPA: NAD(P)-dependent oxidoreductase [Bdellovibrionota bacterium]|nr:NAD(P)-dependent oxidoreductase [Bdellovibrionota bacterium]